MHAQGCICMLNSLHVCQQHAVISFSHLPHTHTHLLPQIRLESGLMDEQRGPPARLHQGWAGPRVTCI
jgi:hypothetical protein